MSEEDPRESHVTSPSSPGGRTPSEPANLVSRLLLLRSKLEQRSPRVERALLVAALLLFAATTVTGYLNLPSFRSEGVRPAFLLLALLAAVATLAVNGWEFALNARLLGRPTGLVRALRISVLASAANALPVPGAILVKTRALRQDGHSYRSSLSSTGAIGFIWVGLATTLTGLLMMLDAEAAGWIFLAGGVSAMVLAWVVLHRELGGARASTAFVRIAFVELASIGAGALRMYAIVRGIGYEATPGQSVALITAGIVASAAGILPGGLGLRELLSAGFGRLARLAAPVALFASAVDRLVLATVLLIMSLLLVVGYRERDAGPPLSDHTTPGGESPE